MGRNNKQRRAAKARERRRPAAGPRPHVCDATCAGGFDPVAFASALLASAAGAVSEGETTLAGDVAAVLLAPDSPVSPAEAGHAAGELLASLLAALWGDGWQPDDLHHLVGARLKERHHTLLVAALADEAQSYSWARIDARWQQQLTALGALPGAWTGSAPAQRPAEVLAACIELVALLIGLPPVQELLPLPGTARPGPTGPTGPTGPAGGEGDDRQLARVRALLAKAESSEFPDEAEALSAKAQELMTRHSLQRRLVETDQQQLAPVVGRRLWLDAPYAGAKALLVDEVARANRCSAVWSEQLGFTCVLGAERDVAAVELLTTSLLVQATRAMVDGAAASAAQRQRRTRSFRQSFLIAYAQRVGERLTGSAEQVRGEFDAPGLLPALRVDADRVEAERRRLFPHLVSKPVSVNNGAGWAAGRAAADAALLDDRLRVTEAARAAS